MADDPELTPADPGSVAPRAAAGDAAAGTSPPTRLDGSSPPVASRPGGTSGPAAGPAGGSPGPAAGPAGGSPGPVATNPSGPPAPSTQSGTGPALATPAAAQSNATPTITRPAPKPPPIAMPRPGPSAPPRPTPTPGPAAPAPATPAPARPQADWAAQVADRIDEVVAKVRANTSDRLVGIARIVVFGLLAVILGLTAVVLALILFFRVLAVIPGPVWIPYLVLGAIFVVVGLLLWSKRAAKPSPG